MMSATCLSTPRSLTGGTSLRPISLLLRPSGIQLATSSWRAVSPPPRGIGIGRIAATGANDHYGIDPGRILANFQLVDGKRDRAIECGPIGRPMDASDGGL